MASSSWELRLPQQGRAGGGERGNTGPPQEGEAGPLPGAGNEVRNISNKAAPSLSPGPLLTALGQGGQGATLIQAPSSYPPLPIP